MMKHALLVLFLAALVGAQATSWPPRFDKGNRYEGLVDLLRSSTKFEVLSFLSAQPTTKPNPTLMRVSFYCSTHGSAVVYSRELVDVRQYRMESKPISTRPGWNDFEWPSGDVILPAQLSINELGFVVVVRDSGSATSRLAPATIGQASGQTKTQTYALIVKSQYTLKRLSYSLIRTSGSTEITLRTRTVDGPVTGGEPFPVEIDLAGVPEGLLKMRISGEYAYQQGGPIEEYSFFHKP